MRELRCTLEDDTAEATASRVSRFSADWHLEEHVPELCMPEPVDVIEDVVDGAVRWAVDQAGRAR